ncbi:MAG: LCP family protein [Anaerolineae bacterium]|nr:LCP family protein [Anaerolineae bacterium]
MRSMFFAPRLLSMVMIALLIGAGGLLGYTIYSTARDMVVSAQFELPEPPSVPVIQRQASEGVSGGETTTGQPPESPLAAALASPQRDRINILILGLDVLDGSVEPARTDTLILVSIDPSGGPINMLSIPRDLWVPIGPYGESRINTAYFLGETRNYPGGGAGLLRATIEQSFGIPIHYHVCVDFAGFLRLVDYLGGVTINVERDIYDAEFPDGQGGTKTIHIPAGLQHMDAETALQYARSRHGNSDFDRAYRQQWLLIALRDELLRNESIPGLISKLPALYKTFSSSVETDLSLDDLIKLARIANGVDLNNVQMAVIDLSMTSRYITEQGWDVLLPIPEKIEPVVDRFFRTPSPRREVPQYELEASPEIAAEDASIMLVNGSGRQGLAEAAAEYLRALGFRVSGASDLDRGDYTSSVMIIYTEKPATVAALASALGLTSQNIRTSPSSPDAGSADIKVILGQDFRLSLD